MIDYSWIIAVLELLALGLSLGLFWPMAILAVEVIAAALVMYFVGGIGLGARDRAPKFDDPPAKRYPNVMQLDVRRVITVALLSLGLFAGCDDIDAEEPSPIIVVPPDARPYRPNYPAPIVVPVYPTPAPYRPQPFLPPYEPAPQPYPPHHPQPFGPTPAPHHPEPYQPQPHHPSPMPSPNPDPTPQPHHPHHG